MVLKNKNYAAKALRHKITPGLFKRDRSLCEPLILRDLVAENQLLKSVPILKLTACFLLIFVVVTGCEELTDNQQGNIAPTRMVVDAMITNQPGESYVKLSLPLANPNEPVKIVSGAIITFSDGKNIVSLIEDSSEKGKYMPNILFRGVIKKKYKILVQKGVYKDSANTYMVPVTPLIKFATTADDSRPGFSFIMLEYSGDPAIIKYIIDPLGCSGEPGCQNIIYEYKLNSFDVPQIFSPDKESLSFPNGSRVIRKKYSLNPDYESYIRAVLSETEWRGGLFDVQAGNPTGNFGENTLGYFAGCSLVMDTVYFQ